MDGDMTFDKKYEDTIRIVNLEHETLKLIRRTWATIALGGCFKVVDVKRACQDNVWREEIIERSLITLKDQRTLRNDAYWNTFSDYSWFYKYFKTRKYKL